MKRRAAKVTAGIALVFAMAGSEACRTATQVELVVTYNGMCSDLQEVAFIVGTDQTAAEGRIETNVFTTTTSHCEPGSPSRVGSLVVTPNDATERASIIVLASFGGQHVTDCKPEKGYAGCIIARRAFAFVDHTALTLEIPLEQSCKNVPCDAISTCKNAKCVASDVSCGASGCSEPGVIADGGIAFTDAPTDPDAYVQGLDGAPPPTDGAIADAPFIDAPPDTSVGMDASGCTGSNQPVDRCDTSSGQKACTMASSVCCYGFSSGGAGPEAGPMAGYDCRSPGACASPDNGNFNVNCRSAANCLPAQVCCYYGGFGTFCASGPPCPGQDAMMTEQACQNDCECPSGRTCTSSRSIGSSPMQTVTVCQ